MEQQLARNARELGVVEGSLLGTGERPQVIGFTSCFDGEGKTTTALNAAYGIGQTGSERVLLVDANPVRPRLQQLFSVHSGPGLGEVLLGTVPVEDALHPTKYKGLEVLAAGSGWSAFGHSLPTVRLKAFLDIVRAAYDCIIIDSTSLFTASDAMLAAPLMDGVVITVACEHTKWEAVQAAAEKVRGAGGRVLGVALNRRKYYIPKKVYQWLSG
jgi:capsular exopolysaccharide synthesis family protein